MNFRHLHDIAFFCFIFFLKDSQMVTPPPLKKKNPCILFLFVLKLWQSNKNLKRSDTVFN